MLDIKIQTFDNTRMTADCKMKGTGEECFKELITINYTILNNLYPGMTESLVSEAAETVKQAIIIAFKDSIGVQINRKKG